MILTRTKKEQNKWFEQNKMYNLKKLDAQEIHWDQCWALFWRQKLDRTITHTRRDRALDRSSQQAQPRSSSIPSSRIIIITLLLSSRSYVGRRSNHRQRHDRRSQRNQLRPLSFTQHNTQWAPRDHDKNRLDSVPT